jgi:hypothetical protein
LAFLHIFQIFSKKYEKYGRTPSGIVKRYGQYRRKVSSILKRFGKYRRKL